MENSNTDDCTNNPSGYKRSQVQQPLPFDADHPILCSVGYIESIISGLICSIEFCSLAGLDFGVAAGVVLLYISAGLALWSLAVYMRKIWRILLK